MTDAALTFDPAIHEYRWQGKPVAHVTGVLDEVMNWAVVPPAYLELGRQRGQAVHALTQSEDEDALEDWMVPMHLAPYVLAYRAFKAEMNPTWAGVEERVFHKVHRYAGQLDRRGHLCDGDDRLEYAYIDIKTGADHPAYGLQLSAYVEAKEPGLALSEPNRYVLLLRDDGTYKLSKRKTKHREDFAVFLSLLTAARWKERHQC